MRFSRQARRRQRANDIDAVLAQNIDALLEVRREFNNHRSIPDRIADAITAFTGSLRFVCLHAVLILAWILVNTRSVGIAWLFDPFPFSLLAIMATLEAIFLSTFVLISQNRMARLAERRNDLDLQINLLAEHEITRLIALVDAIAERLDVPHEVRPHVEHLKEELAPQEVLEKIDRAERELEKR